MKTIYILFLFSVVIISCTNTKESTTDSKKSESLTAKISKRAQDDSLIKVDSSLKIDTALNKKNIFEYSYQNDTLHQEIAINYLNKHQFTFHITVKNKARNKEAQIEGLADDSPGGNSDLGTNTDEDGDDYFVRSFSFGKDGCTLNFDIEAIQRDKVQITEMKCTIFHDLYCPFATVGILKLVK